MTVEATAARIRRLAEGLEARTALVLGSGLNDLADQLGDARALDYTDLPAFAAPTVEGHAGRLIAGRFGEVPLICLQGRMHYYEGHPVQALAAPIRALRLAGIDRLILTNAAGGLREDMTPGELMAISDHINLAGANPLIGPNDERFGERFVDLTDAYDRELRGLLHATAADLDIPLHEGVYLWCSGPNFETPAEIRAFRVLGADAVGMSTVPECLVANHCGMRVVAISTITNLAAGMTGQTLSHEETLAMAAVGARNLQRLLAEFLPRLAAAN